MRKTGNLMGVLLLIVGMVLLFNNLGLITLSWKMLWPIFPMLVGVSLFLQFFRSRDKGVLIPATMLTGVGLFFFLFTLPHGIPWSGMGLWWPVFPLFLGLGFFFAYLADTKDTSLLFPATVLLVVGSVFLATNVQWAKTYLKYWPVILIIVGIVVFLGSTGEDKTGPTEPQA